jgi:hypothetical protein
MEMRFTLMLGSFRFIHYQPWSIPTYSSIFKKIKKPTLVYNHGFQTNEEVDVDFLLILS